MSERLSQRSLGIAFRPDAMSRGWLFYSLIRRIGEPDLVTEMPWMLHQILNGSVDPILGDRPEIGAWNTNFWMSVLYLKLMPEIKYPFAGFFFSAGSSEFTVPKAPALWFNPFHEDIRVGAEYGSTRSISVDAFLRMDREEVLNWANKGWESIEPPACFDSWSIERRLS